MVLAFETGRDFPMAARNATCRATRSGALLDSLAILSLVQRRRAFAVDNRRQQAEASCCRRAPESCRSQCRRRRLTFVAILDWQSTGFRPAQLENRFPPARLEFSLSARQRSGRVLFHDRIRQCAPAANDKCNWKAPRWRRRLRCHFEY